ncbi:MAG: hypothetical protein JNK90_10670 [Planctomycetaceae bacterium]|nr:hypothetical protein [Planctomycetaceae bacterium]
MNEPQLHESLGTCPVCEGGQCRVRWCGGCTPELPIVLCDECDAYWATPDTTQPPGFLNSETGRVGESNWSAWDDSARWATKDEVTLLGWDRPSGPISTDWVLPATDSTVIDAISFFMENSSITITGPDFTEQIQVLGPAQDAPPPAKDP